MTSTKQIAVSLLMFLEETYKNSGIEVYCHNGPTSTALELAKCRVTHEQIPTVSFLVMARKLVHISLTVTGILELGRGVFLLLGEVAQNESWEDAADGAQEIKKGQPYFSRFDTVKKSGTFRVL